MKKRTVKTFASGEAMATFAASLLKKALRAHKGQLTVALSGGKTPAGLFRVLSRLDLTWERVVFFMADERRVPRSSPHSNFGLAQRSLFSPAGVPASNLRPPRGAAAYEAALLKATGGTGRLDLVFLGIGEDGHTASLFPGSPALKSRRLVANAAAPRGAPGPRRLTLTPRALNGAGCLVLMAAGPGKKEVLLRAARGDASIPAGSLRPKEAIFLFSAKK